MKNSDSFTEFISTREPVSKVLTFFFLGVSESTIEKVSNSEDARPSLGSSGIEGKWEKLSNLLLFLAKYRGWPFIFFVLGAISGITRVK